VLVLLSKQIFTAFHIVLFVILKYIRFYIVAIIFYFSITKFTNLQLEA